MPEHVVIGMRGLERAVEGAKPEVRAVVGLTDLGHPLALGPLADATVGGTAGCPARPCPSRKCVQVM